MNKFHGYGILKGMFRKCGTYRVDIRKEVIEEMRGEYRGFFKDGVINGKGTIYYQDGESLEACFLNAGTDNFSNELIL